MTVQLARAATNHLPCPCPPALSLRRGAPQRRKLPPHELQQLLHLVKHQPVVSIHLVQVHPPPRRLLRPQELQLPRLGWGKGEGRVFTLRFSILVVGSRQTRWFLPQRGEQ